jgi:multiple sugar transport system ATP-binding protein
VADVRFVEATRVFRGMWKPAVDAVTLDVRAGELLVLTGASGSGKSTLLRMLAGAEPLDRGRILIDGQDVARVAPDKRGVSLLAQGFALFPHLTVAENIAFPLTMRKVSAKTAGARVGQFAELCGLSGHLGARPDTLSVDLRQRAIMARAMVTKPRVICLDEPLAGASVPVMLRDRTPIATLQRESGITMLYATCSSTDARSFADRIAVLDRGVLHQVDTPHTVFDQPGTVAVAEFVGAPPMNLVPAVVADGHARIGGIAVPIRPRQQAALTADRVIIGLRPEEMLIGAAEHGLRATAVLVKDSGREYLVHARIEVPGGTADVVLRHTSGPVPVLGENFVIGVEVERAHLFDAATGRRLPG